MDAKGESKDPWQFTNTLVLMTQDADDIFTFSTTSGGGMDALAKLSNIFGKAAEAAVKDERPFGGYPLIVLEVGSYQHREYGRIKFPIFDLLKFVDAARYDAALAKARGEPAEPYVATPIEESTPKKLTVVTSGLAQLAASMPPAASHENLDDGHVGIDPQDGIPF